MPYVTQAELAEIVQDLRAMAIIEVSAEVRAALNRLADRYTAMAPGCKNLRGSSLANSQLRTPISWRTLRDRPQQRQQKSPSN